MKQKYLSFIIVICLAVISSSLFFTVKSASANVNDFSFSSFEADYYLSKDSEGHSNLRVVEKLTAEFKNFNQNHGIERAVPKFYDGHSVAFRFESMQRNGVIEPLFEQRDESEFIVLSTKRNDFVNGTQKYIFTYTLRDVTKDFGNHQELYWDANGTGWSQSFGSLITRVHLDESVRDDFTGAVSCYEGVADSQKQCSHSSATSGYGDVIIGFKSNGSLRAYENLTMNLSFKAGAFVGYEMTLLDYFPYVLLFIVSIFFVLAIYNKFRYGRNHPGKGTIVAEYIPPKDISLLLAADLFGNARGTITAQLLDLAVRKKIRIIESEKKLLGLFKSKEYTLELLNVDNLDKDQTQLVVIFFMGLVVGSRYVLKRTDTSIAIMVDNLTKSVKEESQSLGYRVKQTKKAVLQIILLVIVFGLTIWAAIMSVTIYNYISFIGSVIFSILCVLSVVLFKIGSMRPLTESGRALHDYMKGLKLYIKMAESDRINYLQSPNGSQKEAINTGDSKMMVVLYEKLLPYAVLFGQEKKWLKQMVVYYESTSESPYWYSGTGHFNAAAFASSVGSFSSYSSSSSSSGSSGAGGGGSSGGGGGGGGGGGC